MDTAMFIQVVIVVASAFVLLTLISMTVGVAIFARIIGFNTASVLMVIGVVITWTIVIINVIDKFL